MMFYPAKKQTWIYLLPWRALSFLYRFLVKIKCNYSKSLEIISVCFFFLLFSLICYVCFYFSLLTLSSIPAEMHHGSWRQMRIQSCWRFTRTVTLSPATATTDGHTPPRPGITCMSYINICRICVTYIYWRLVFEVSPPEPHHRQLISSCWFLHSINVESLLDRWNSVSCCRYCYVEWQEDYWFILFCRHEWVAQTSSTLKCRDKNTPVTCGRRHLSDQLSLLLWTFRWFVGSRWFQVIRCRLCGSKGTHRKCSGLKLDTHDWACTDCTKATDGKGANHLCTSLESN